MSLRALAAADLAAIDADANGPAESLIYTPQVGSPIPYNGVFIDYGRISSHQVGVGAQRDRGDARTRIPVALVAHFDPASTITRTATGEEFKVTNYKLVAGVAWRVELATRGPARPRGIRG